MSRRQLKGKPQAYLIVLADPTDNKVRYVTTIINDKQRAADFLAGCASADIRLGSWLVGLLHRDYYPIMAAIDSGSISQMLEAETYWRRRLDL